MEATHVASMVTIVRILIILVAVLIVSGHVLMAVVFRLIITVMDLLSMAMRAGALIAPMVQMRF